MKFFFLATVAAATVAGSATARLSGAFSPAERDFFEKVNSKNNPQHHHFEESGKAGDIRNTAKLSRHGANNECSVQTKVDCGHVGTKQPDCEASGCCWQPAPGTSDPWCFHKKGSISSCPLNYTSPAEPPFSADEVKTMRGFFLKNINIQGSGAVVASPDKDTPGGSYYYHWERDGALSMGALLKTADSVDDVKDLMDAYVGWVTNVQSQPDPHGQSVLAEPKYLIPSGQVYPDGWCRPQNDGPGLRSKTLINYANALDEAGLDGSSDLWTLIQTDLDWQADNWQANGCDLWEEIRSDDFFWNRFTQRAALSVGSTFAQKQGDSARASKYAAAMKQIEDSLQNHYNGNFIYESTNREKDASVITALNDGYLGDGVFAPSGKEAAGTVETLNTLFCDAFQVNQDATKAGIPGILYGRYEGDSYAGGNPWILLTSALAELLYHGATEMASGLSTTDGLSAWARVVGLDETADSADIATAMVGAGDGVLTRLRHYVKGDGFHLAEQLDRNTGSSLSATDLTWSYGTTLKAVHARSQYFETIKSGN